MGARARAAIAPQGRPAKLTGGRGAGRARSRERRGWVMQACLLLALNHRLRRHLHFAVAGFGRPPLLLYLPNEDAR